MARRPKHKNTRKPRSPGDYEAELVRMCQGNRQRAEQLIADYLAKAPGGSRQGAALAVVTRLRHEQVPLKATL